MTELKADVVNGIDFKVADLSLAEFRPQGDPAGRAQMPGLMTPRREYADVLPLKGARVSGSLHMTIQTAVLIETLRRARCRGAVGVVQHLLHPGLRGRGRASSARTAPRGPSGTPVFAWKGESLEEYWWAAEQMLTWPGEPANMILDDGGDATMLVLRGAQYEKAGVVPPGEDDDSDEWKVFLSLVRERFETDKDQVDQDRRVGPGRHRGDHHRRSCGFTSSPLPVSWRSPRSTSTTRSPRASSTTSTAPGTR